MGPPRPYASQPTNAGLAIGIDAIPLPLVVIDRGGSFVCANDHACRLFGYEPGELAGRPVNEVLPELCPEEGTGTVRERELLAVRREGEELLVQISMSALAAGQRRVAVFRDVTTEARRREEVEEALRHLKLQGKLSDLILSSLHGRVAVLDCAGTILAVNESWRQFGIDSGAGVTARLGVGINYLETCERAGTSDAQEAVEGIRAVLTGSRSVFTMRYPCHSPSGKSWFSMTVTPMSDQGAIVVHTDVTSEVLAHQELEQALREITRLKERSEAEGQYLQEEIKSDHNFDDIVGNSGELLATLKKLEQVAETNATVLLHGETGTGKELLARATHAKSKRGRRPLIKVDCTTLPPGLIESELFGHEKGAFTGAHQSQAGRFELAHRGTIFLDEVGELPLELQPKLLRVIQDGELERVGGKEVKKVDVRVIAATNRNLLDEVNAGRFRADLYYRLNVFPVEVPPLRDRPEDVPALASFFVEQKSKELGKNVDRIPPATMENLMGYDWPGNIRELQNVIERAIILSPSRDLFLAEPLNPRQEQPDRPSGVLRNDLEKLERHQILDALRASAWKIKGDGNAASRLGLKPSTLRSRMKRLGIGRQ